jgi:hypothetical protein
MMMALAFAALLPVGARCQTGNNAGLLDISGTSSLADAFGTATGSEALSVNWSVVENPSLVYTYSFTIQNPAGDVLLNNNGSPTSTPEIVDAFSVGFNTTVPGAFIAGSQTGGLSQQNNGVDGLFWTFAAVDAGTNSPTLSFESDLPPTLGNACAQGANPPSPWSSVPYGQQDPVPQTATQDVPDSATTFTLLAAVLLLLVPFRPAFLKSTGG